MTIFGFDIGAALTPDVSIIEVVVRGAVMYLVILVLLRYMMRGRTSASMPDLLVVVLIADAAQNGMSAQYNSITNGVALVATIIGMSTLLDWLGYRVPVIERFIHPDKRPLVLDGRPVTQKLAAEWISDDELMTQLRLQGVDRVEDVKAAYLEGTGAISVIKKDGDSEPNRKATPA